MTGNALDIIAWLYSQDRETKFDIDIHKEKRSLNANSYCWVLCTKIADKLTSGYDVRTKEEVYEMMLRSYGQSLKIPVAQGSKPDGYFKYYDYKGRSILNGKIADWYIVYKGSSEYNTHEMSVLLNGIVHEAQNLGIETRPKEEIESLLKEWK